MLPAWLLVIPAIAGVAGVAGVAHASDADAPTVGVRVADIALPEGSLIISVLRDGSGFVPKPDTVLEAGDEVLLVLDPGLEESITAYFAPNGRAVQT